MKIYLVLSVLFLISSVNAQIVLNSDRKPVIGDTFTTSDMDTTGVTEGASGANITWDFSNLVATGEQWSAQYIHPSEAVGDSLFPDADVAVEYEELSYTFYDTDGNNVHSLGLAFEEFAIVYTNTEKIAEFPFTFNSNFLDNFQAEYELGEGLLNRHIGINQFTGDAYGTIILPGGNSHAALRVKIFRHSTDTMYVSGIPFSTTDVISTTYQWYTNESKYPVFGISYNEINVNGSITKSKQVDYNTGTTTDVEDKPQQTVNGFELFQNHPNPFNPSTTISWQMDKTSHVSLKIYDSIGREVKTLVDQIIPAGKHEMNFDAGSLSSGVYFYTLSSDNFAQTKKLLLLK